MTQTLNENEQALLKIVALDTIRGVQGVAIESLPRQAENASWHTLADIQGFVRLDWTGPPPKGEDLAAITSQLEVAIALQKKRQKVVDGYASAVAAGYDTGLGFSLKLGEQDQRVLFDYQQRLLRQLAKDPPEAALNDVKVLKGTDDAWHIATVGQIIDVIDGGANQIESLNVAYAGYEALLAAGVVDFEVAF